MKSKIFEDNTNKPIVKVLLVVEDNLDTSETHRIDKNDVNTGYAWNIFLKIKEALYDKYDFKLIYTDPKDTNYDQFVKDTHEGKYDLVIGQFFYTKEREKLIDYTKPVLIDGNVILHLRETNLFTQMRDIFLSVINLLVILVIVGSISGIILYVFDNKRTHYLDQVTSSKKSIKSKLIRSLLTGISASFGEMGFLSENSTLNIIPMLITIVIMSISFILVMFIQGKITNNIIQASQSEVISTSNIPSKPCLGFKGYSVTKKLERYGVKIKYIDNVGLNKMLEMYLKNSDKYGGCVLSFVDAYILTKHDTSKTTISDLFGLETSSFIVNQQKDGLLEDIDKVILELRNSLELSKLCKGYFQNVTQIPICSLT